MYENSFIFAFSDNGGQIGTGASNHPYRGMYTYIHDDDETYQFIY